MSNTQSHIVWNRSHADGMHPYSIAWQRKSNGSNHRGAGMRTDLAHDVEGDIHPLGWRKSSLWV